MASSAQVKIGVEGAVEFKKNLANITQQSKSLAAEMKATASAFTSEANAEEKNNKVKEILAKQMVAQQQKIDRLKQAVEAYSQAEGENGTNTLKYREALAKAETEMNGLESEARKLENGVEGVGNGMNDASDKSSRFGDVLKANVISEAIISGVKLLAKAVKEVGGAIKDCITDSAAFADNILTLSTVTGISTATLQEWQYMQELTDVSLDTMTGSMTKLIRNMNSAKDGSKTTAAAFEELGISVVDETGSLRNNQDVFYEVIAALGEMENETERDATAMELFGKSAQDLNPIIELGADGMKAFADEAHEMGYVLDGEALSSLGGIDDAFQRMKTASDALKNKIGVALAPTISKLADKLLEIVKNADFSKINAAIDKLKEKFGGVVIFFSSHSEQIKAVINGIKTAFENVANFISEHKEAITTALIAIGTAFATWKVVEFVNGIPAMIGKVAAAAKGLFAVISANPIGAIITAVAALVAAFIHLWNTNDNFRNALIGAWQTIKDGVITAVEAVKGAFASVGEFITGLIDKAKTWGKDLIDGFIKGIKEKIGAVKQAAKDIANSIREFLHFSRPDVGPLREYEAWMPDMMRGLAKGIRDNSYLLDAALTDATSGLGVNVNGAAVRGGGGNVINIYTQDMSESQIDYLYYRFNARLGEA